MATGSLVDAALLDEFHAMSRAPFRVELARLLGLPRDLKAWEAWANKNPDRYAQAVAIFGRLAGYTEKVEVEHHGTLQALIAEIGTLSDAQLEARHRALVSSPRVLPADASVASRAEGPRS